MRCVRCGWLANDNGCPCGKFLGVEGGMVAVGTRVLARPGRGPSMLFWEAGEILGHSDDLHRVRTMSGDYWCEVDDLLPESRDRELALLADTRVWARWVNGRWYPGTIDACRGPLRHVAWDDGDTMWLDTSHMVLLAAEAGQPQVDSFVLARRWNGEQEPARIEQQDGDRYRVTFGDGEEEWVTGEDLQTFPANPFLD
jgi:hypothetical protein